MVGHEVAEQVAAHGQWHAPDGPVVLDRDGHARERPGVALGDALGCLQGRVVRDVGECVDRGLELVDPLKRRGDQLARADVALADQLRQLLRGAEEQLVHGPESVSG